MRVLWIPVLLGFAFGCTATRLATLQGDFNALYAAKHACDGSPETSLPCDGQDVALYQLALDAEAAAGKAKDPRTRITLLRLAGVSAWQGAGEQADALVTKVSLQGVKECDALEQQVRARETWGAPRDCALLVLLPALLAHDVQLERLAVLQAAGACTAGDVTLADIVDDYADSTVLFVHAREGKALGYTGVSDSVRSYVGETQRRMLCNFQKVRDFEPGLCPAENERALEQKDRMEAELQTTFLDECG